MRIAPKNNPRSHQCFSSLSRDKSLSHRSIIFAFLTSGECEIEGFLHSKDTLSTLQIAKDLGAQVQIERGKILLSPPKSIAQRAILQCNNAGTAMRLYAGLLSSRNGGEYEFLGDESLSQRPMDRIRIPLEQMGAQMNSNFAPFILKGNTLKGVSYHSPIASAQVKGAFILASLFASGKSLYFEPELTRDHSERFLCALGAEIERIKGGISISPLRELLRPYCFCIPNDPSSVVFFVIACLISEGLSMEFENVLLNPTRIEVFEVLKKMGAQLHYQICSNSIEPIGWLRVRSSKLRAIKIDQHIPWLIDEIPALSLALASAQGVSEIRGIEELRVKESDRLACILYNLQALGIEAQAFEGGLRIRGGEFRSAVLKSFGDHRIAMSFALAGLKTEIRLEGSECVEISFPDYFKRLSEYAEVEQWK